MKLLKVLTKDLKSPYQNFQYELGKWYECHNFDERDNDCGNGFYAVDFNGLIYCLNDEKDYRVFEVEVKGSSKEFDCFKRRFENIKINRKISLQELATGLLKANKTEGYNVLESVFPYNPLIGEVKNVSEREINLLKQWIEVQKSIEETVWDSVWQSIKKSTWRSVFRSVHDSIQYSIHNSIRESVWDSVWDSIWESIHFSIEYALYAYTSSLFPNISKWKYIEHEEGVNPFQSAIELWRSGFIPTFDGKTWRLHSGKDTKIVYEMKV